MSKGCHRLVCLILLKALLVDVSAQTPYDGQYVSLNTGSINGDAINVVRMSRKDNRVKVKYFACKDGGKLAYNRYQEWARNKAVVAYSSGLYMNDCDNPYRATPIGVCFDNGTMVNGAIKNDMDGLAIVYATGGMVASNLKEGNLSITETSSGNKTSLNLRNSLDFVRFKSWAAAEAATVFQTHLLYYKDQLGVGSNGSTQTREWRFLAVCKDEDDNIVHFLINLAGNNSLYEGTTKVADYLRGTEDVSSILFMLNLDPGCNNIFQVYDPAGNPLPGDGFNGMTPITNAMNLIVYHYE
jgi:hypothetical protein